MKTSVASVGVISLLFIASSASADVYKLDLPALKGTFPYGFGVPVMAGNTGYGPLIVPFDFGVQFESINSVVVTMGSSTITFWSETPVTAPEGQVPDGWIHLVMGFDIPSQETPFPGGPITGTILQDPDAMLLQNLKTGRGNLQFSLMWEPTSPIDYSNFVSPAPLAIDQAYITVTGQAVAAPEPSSLVLFGLLLAGKVLRQRTRAK